MAVEKQAEEPAFELVGFDPSTLTIEDIAFIMLCRRMKFGTIQDVAVNQGRPTVVKMVAQRLDLTVAREGILAARGEIDTVPETPNAIFGQEPAQSS